ncbi:MAG: hypothetical protein PHD74_10095 [Candidatus Krumholzibacteria bacterium]|nr:hypothetical protein [Candidatus Krumholzibacteria bacterium]
MRRISIAIMALIFLMLAIPPITAQGGVGLRLFGGGTKIAAGDFAAALNGGTESESSSLLVGIGIYAGSGQIEYSLSWYNFQLESSTTGSTPSRGSSNQFMLHLAIRPLELGRSTGIAVLCGFAVGVGESEATLAGQRFSGFVLQPEIVMDLPLTSSEEGTERDGKFYPRTILSLDIRIGMRSATLSKTYEEDGPQLDWSGAYCSIGLSFYFNPR